MFAVALDPETHIFIGEDYHKKWWVLWSRSAKAIKLVSFYFTNRWGTGLAGRQVQIQASQKKFLFTCYPFLHWALSLNILWATKLPPRRLLMWELTIVMTSTAITCIGWFQSLRLSATSFYHDDSRHDDIHRDDIHVADFHRDGFYPEDFHLDDVHRDGSWLQQWSLYLWWLFPRTFCNDIPLSESHGGNFNFHSGDIHHCRDGEHWYSQLWYWRIWLAQCLFLSFSV